MLFLNPASEGIRNTLYVAAERNEVIPKFPLLQTKKVRDNVLKEALKKFRPFPICYFIFDFARIKVSVKASNLIYNIYCI